MRKGYIKSDFIQYLAPKVLAIYAEAAEKGEPTPTRKKISQMLDLGGTSNNSVVRCTHALERQGIIRSEHHGGSIRIQIVSTGKWTGFNNGNRNVDVVKSTIPDRRCLKCHGKFRPEHPVNNRICKTCKYEINDGLPNQWAHTW